MKKVLFALSAVAFFSLASCKKDYTCECAVNGDTMTLPIQDAKKGDAEDACDAAEVTYKNADPEASCELK